MPTHTVTGPIPIFLECTSVHPIGNVPAFQTRFRDVLQSFSSHLCLGLLAFLCLYVDALTMWAQIAAKAAKSGIYDAQYQLTHTPSVKKTTHANLATTEEEKGQGGSRARE